MSQNPSSGMSRRRLLSDVVGEQKSLDSISIDMLWSASSDGLLLVDQTGTIIATNESLDELFGYDVGSLSGSKIEQLVPPRFRDRHETDRQAYEADPVSRPMAASAHLQGLRADGSTFYVSVSLAPIETAQGPLTFASARDLTAAVERETALARVNQLQAIADDHDRIAAALHDSIIQRLFAVGLVLQGLPTRIADDSVSEKIGTAVDTLDEIIHEIRSTIYGLRHTSDPELGLRQRFVGLVTEMESMLGFAPEIRFIGTIESVRDETIIGHLLPVLREGLSNVARHAQASTAVITLTVNDEITLEITDNGRGINDKVIRSGLANMADRAVALSGSFAVAPASPAGTHLRWQVPATAA